MNASKSYGERSARPEGGPRPTGDRAFTGTPRGPRRGDAEAERPAQRTYAPRTRPAGEVQGEPIAPKRPGRNFADKPLSFRPDSGRPQRSDKPPTRSSERPNRPGRDNLGSEAKTYGKPKMRPDGKPYPKRDGAAPQRGPKPGGYGKPAGGRPSGGATRPSGGARPTGGAGRPSGPRRPKA